MPLPGLVGTDHVGFTVPDLDQAHDFFVRILGCTHVYTLGPYAHTDDWMAVHLNVHPRTVMRELRFYRCGTGANFEVFQYESADGQSTQPPRNSDIGGHHLALYVDDLDNAVAYLCSEGIEVLGEPTSSRNASEGQRWVYFLSPWGMQFELVSFPGGKAYETSAEVLLWNPNHPRH
ncbi:VOC family protein [Mycolicibacterium sp.]|uniref:VOC family protein n=1 Tax=Mycolicibacterium sp. TaxID=2320850 RepID=UPI0037C9FC56